MIFDCCHSASGTRSADPLANSDCAIRGVKYRGQLLSHPIFGHPSSGSRTRGVQVASSYTNGGLKSHVLLAACNAREFAREEQKRGAFTIALLDVLYKIDLNDMRNLTYRDLLKRIPQLRYGCFASVLYHCGRLLISFNPRSVTKTRNAKAISKIDLFFNLRNLEEQIPYFLAGYLEQAGIYTFKVVRRMG